MSKTSDLTKLAALVALIGVAFTFFVPVAGLIILACAFALYSLGMPNLSLDEEEAAPAPHPNFDDYLKMPEDAPAPSIAHFSPLTVVKSDTSEPTPLSVLPAPVELSIVDAGHGLSVVKDD